jgi:hypothetical protein
LAQSNDFHWQGPLHSGGTVLLSTFNGNLAIAPSTDGKVDISAHRYRLAGKRMRHPHSLAEVGVQVVPHGGGLTVCAVYPSFNAQPNGCDPATGGPMNVSESDIAVDFVVRIPSGLKLVSTNMYGNIDINLPGNDVKADSFGGRISIEASRDCEASTYSGPIRIYLARAGQKTTLSTMSGPIELHAQGPIAGTNLSTTRGEVFVDGQRLSEYAFRSRFGSGPTKLAISTGSGDIRLFTH